MLRCLYPKWLRWSPWSSALNLCSAPLNYLPLLRQPRDCRRSWTVLICCAIGTRENLATRTYTAAGHGLLSTRVTWRDGVLVQTLDSFWWLAIIAGMAIGLRAPD